MVRKDSQESLSESGADTALATSGGAFAVIGAVLERSREMLKQDDYDGPREKPSIAFYGIRQKDLKDSNGRVARHAGPFKTGKTDDLEFEDRPELLLTILGYAPGRVYFEKLTDKQPTCRSDDMRLGSHERDGDRYGECASCRLSKWGSAENGRQACRENRRLLAIDWSNERPVVLTLGPSSLKPWIRYNQHVEDVARGLTRDGKVPFIHHLTQVKVETEYRAEPAGHYVVVFKNPGMLPLDVQRRMADFRGEALQGFYQETRRQEYDAGDYVGGEEAPPL